MRLHENSELVGRLAALNEISALQADILGNALEAPAALALIIERMIELTRANGAAIAIRDGDGVVCVASLGNAPGAGVKLSSTSLSGGCFRTGKMILVGDSEADGRVDPEICRQLGFRSLLIMPVKSASEIVGIAEVLSPNARNFDDGDVLVLSLLTDVIASVVSPPAASAPPPDLSVLAAPSFNPPPPVRETIAPTTIPSTLPPKIPPSSAAADTGIVPSKKIAPRRRKWMFWLGSVAVLLGIGPVPYGCYHRHNSVLSVPASMPRR